MLWTGFGGCVRSARAQHTHNLRTEGDLAGASTKRGQAYMKREYDLSKGKRGAVVPLSPEKVRITIRLDRDLVDHFRELVSRAHRGNYQTLINDALRDYMQRPSLAQEVGKEVRSVLREELNRVKASA